MLPAGATNARPLLGGNTKSTSGVAFRGADWIFAYCAASTFSGDGPDVVVERYAGMGGGGGCAVRWALRVDGEAVAGGARRWMFDGGLLSSNCCDGAVGGAAIVCCVAIVVWWG